MQPPAQSWHVLRDAIDAYGHEVSQRVVQNRDRREARITRLENTCIVVELERVTMLHRVLRLDGVPAELDRPPVRHAAAVPIGDRDSVSAEYPFVASREKKIGVRRVHRYRPQRVGGVDDQQSAGSLGELADRAQVVPFASQI